MRPGREERPSVLFRVAYGGLFLVIGAGLILRAYAVGVSEATTTFDLMACGATGVCFALAGLALLTHDPRDDACVDTTPSESPPASGPRPPTPPGPRYRDITRPPRPRRILPRRMPAQR